MQFFNAITVLALLGTSCVSATALPNNQGGLDNLAPGNIDLATNQRAACQAPNNGNKKAGDSCRYRAGEAASSPTVSGKCTKQGGMLICIA